MRPQPQAAEEAAVRRPQAAEAAAVRRPRGATEVAVRHSSSQPARHGAAAPFSLQPASRPAAPRAHRSFRPDGQVLPCRSQPRERPSSRMVFRRVSAVFLVVLAVGWSLPWLDCFRYCLPNFPHSPAAHGRERQRFHALLTDGAKTALFFRTIQLIDLCGDYQVRSAMIFKPALQIPVLVHPSSARIQYQAGKLQSFPFLQIFTDQYLPLRHVGRRNPGIAVTRQIDEIARFIHQVEIDGLRASRGTAGKCQLFLPRQSIDQAGFPNVASPQKSNFRQPAAGKCFRPAGTYYKFGSQNARSLTVPPQQTKSDLMGVPGSRFDP